MAYKRIVLATDGSAFAESAEHVAATLARASKAKELLIVHTYERPDKAQAAVERAEARLAAGTYGLSIASGKPIPDERLEAIPTAERTADEEAH